MPWLETSPMVQRQEFVRLVQCKALTVAELCRRFGISRKTGYKMCYLCPGTFVTYVCGPYTGAKKVTKESTF